ncbi:MAG: nitroreductase family protein [Candidatus Saelkia tenebricola]|nr:nitroreductase family protein [Candidatus Saelkia tenebricola]
MEYILITNNKTTQRIFPYTKWAAYIYPQGTPGIKERPLYYVGIAINCTRSSKSDLRDLGAAAENIMLSALGFKIASCWLGAINKKEISKILSLPKHVKLDSLIALGYPKETPKTIETDKKTKYYQDKKGIHYVPKRPLEKILYFNKYGKKD